MPDADYPYRFTWSTGECGPRRGQLCRIVNKNPGGFKQIRVMVEFADGARYVVHRAALQRIVGC